MTRNPAEFNCSASIYNVSLIISRTRLNSILNPHRVLRLHIEYEKIMNEPLTRRIRSTAGVTVSAGVND